MTSPARSENPEEIWLLRAVYPSSQWRAETHVNTRAYARFDLMRKALRHEIGRTHKDSPIRDKWTCYRIDLETMTIYPLTHEQVL